MKRIVFIYILLFIVFSSSSLIAGADFYEDIPNGQRQKVVFNFGGSDEWKSVVDEVDGKDYGTYSSGDTWILKGGEAFVWKDNGSDILSVTLHYSVYKDGDNPVFHDIDLPWVQNYAGTNNQRWASTAENIDILSYVNSSGLWHVAFYYSAATNGQNCDNPIYFSNNGANYVLDFTADQSLDLNMVSFSGYAGKAANILEWTTLSEINMAIFYVERSVSGKEWTLVNKKEATGDSYIQQDYKLVDKEPLTKAFYRLRMIDKDGRYSMSKVISIERKDSGLKLNAVYPNPNDGNFVVNLTSMPNEDGKIILVNTLGVKVFTKELSAQGGNIIEKINVSHLPTGVYTLLLEQNDKIITKRVMINR